MLPRVLITHALTRLGAMSSRLIRSSRNDRGQRMLPSPGSRRRVNVGVSVRHELATMDFSPPVSHAQRDAAVDTEAKLSLGFILHDAAAAAAASNTIAETVAPLPCRQLVVTTAIGRRDEASRSEAVDTDAPRTRSQTRAKQAVAKTPRKAATASASASAEADDDAGSEKKARRSNAKRPLTDEAKRLARKCTIADCMNYTINKGLCFRHGGGKQCSLEGCSASAKIAGLCWKHGGSVQCVVDGCDRRGKSRGVCWTHGGGTECRYEACAKVAVSKGFCWAHGGGKRCLFDGCKRPAYTRTFNYCPTHYERFENGDEIMEV